MPFADALTDTGDFMMSWYVLLPCCGLFTVLLIAGVVLLVVVLVKGQNRSRRRRRDEYDD